MVGAFCVLLLLGLGVFQAAGRVVWVANALPVPIEVQLGDKHVHVEANAYQAKLFFSSAPIDGVARRDDGVDVERFQIPAGSADYIHNVLAVAPLGFATAVYGVGSAGVLAFKELSVVAQVGLVASSQSDAAGASATFDRAFEVEPLNALVRHAMDAWLRPM